MKNPHSLQLRTICWRYIASIAREEFRSCLDKLPLGVRLAGNGGQLFWSCSGFKLNWRGNAEKSGVSSNPIAVLKPETERRYAVAEVLWVYYVKRLTVRCNWVIVTPTAAALHAAVVCKLSPAAHTRSSFTDLDFDMSAYLCTSIHHQQRVWRK
jgi:hypothetical protein